MGYLLCIILLAICYCLLNEKSNVKLINYVCNLQYALRVYGISTYSNTSYVPFPSNTSILMKRSKVVLTVDCNVTNQSEHSCTSFTEDRNGALVVSLPGVSAWPPLSPSLAHPHLFSCSVDCEFPENTVISKCHDTAFPHIHHPLLSGHGTFTDLHRNISCRSKRSWVISHKPGWW